ncbi:hypothetical protein [Cohnella soli]|uniref:Sporulation protein YunB n=1 Tax=Cohnella soli TaxID=425005 RepID=A0ABW0HPJ3_9BACL
MKKLKIVGNQRGGVGVMIIYIISMLLSVLVMARCLDYIQMYKTQNRLKNKLNVAVHAGSLSIDEVQLSQGNFKLDISTPGTRVQDMFYKYLRMNMRLDNSNVALPGSPLKEGSVVNIDELLYVDYEAGTITNLNTKPTSCTYSSAASRVTCSVTLNPSSPLQVTRTVNETIVGPSLVAIVDSVHEGIGSIMNEPLLIPAVQEVYFNIN